MILRTSLLLITPLHSMVTRRHLLFAYSVCSIYLAPSYDHSVVDLTNVLKQLHSLVNLLSDFIARHPHWEDTMISTNASFLLDLLTSFSLSCLNTGLPTYELLTGYQPIVLYWSHFAPFLCWIVFSGPASTICGSDHYPTIL